MAILPSIYLSYVDGTLSVPQPNQFGDIVVIGPSSLGTANTVYEIGNASGAELKANFGVGPAVELLAVMAEKPNHGILRFVKSTSTYVATSAVVATGTTPLTLAITGNALDAFDIRVECTKLGALGTATVRISLDGGKTWTFGGKSYVTGVISELATDTGLTFTFTGAVTSQLDNVWTSTAQAPYVADSDITVAVQALVDSGKDSELIVVLNDPQGVSDAARLSAWQTTYGVVATAINLLLPSRRDSVAIIQAPRPIASDSSGITAWKNLLSARSVAANGFVTCFAGNSLNLSRFSVAGSSRWVRRNVLFGAMQMICRTFLGIDPSILSDGPISTDILAGSLDYNGLDGTLNQYGFSTIRTWPKYAGYFITNWISFANPGSDYEYAVNSKTVCRCVQLANKELLLYLNQNVFTNDSGTLTDEDAKSIENNVSKNVLEQVRQGVQNFSMYLSRTDNVASTNICSYQYAIKRFGYLRLLTGTAYFSRS